MAEEQVDVEYVSLQGYIRNTASDAEVHACRTPSESGQEDLTSGKEYTDSRRTRQDDGTRGKNVLEGLNLPWAGGGTEARVRFPHWGNCLGQRRNTQETVKELICCILNGMRLIDSPCPNHAYPGEGGRLPGRCSGWELELRDCGASPCEGCHCLLRDRLRDVEGGDCGGLQYRFHASAILQTHAQGWSHPPSLLPASHQHWQLNHRDAGPSNA